MREPPVPNERELDGTFLLRKSCPSSASKPQRFQRMTLLTLALRITLVPK